MEATRSIQRSFEQSPTKRSSAFFGPRACASARRSRWSAGTSTSVSGVITVREAKFGRSRLVPLHRTATEALCTYAKRRDTLCDHQEVAAFFVSSASTPLRPMAYGRIQRDHHENRHPDQRRSRGIHDIRHSFAVRVLIEWYRAGVTSTR